MIEKEELLEILAEVYGDLNDDSGCYNGGEWFSLKRIVDLIDMCSVE